MIRKGYRYLLTAVIAASAAALLTFAARNDFGLGRNMEITVNMMRELSLGYVDPVDPDKLMEGAAEGMVSDLDPYTEFIPDGQQHGIVSNDIRNQKASKLQPLFLHQIPKFPH